jgi:hypothetical protein
MIPSNLLSHARLYRSECRNLRRFRGITLSVEISVVSDVSAASVDLDVSNISLSASSTRTVILSGRWQIGRPPTQTVERKKKRDIRVTPARHRQ